MAAATVPVLDHPSSSPRNSGEWVAKDSSGRRCTDGDVVNIRELGHVTRSKDLVNIRELVKFFGCKIRCKYAFWCGLPPEEPARRAWRV
ncbi:hypothetical protein SUGI_1086900 [Cryptomeria japonica]|nr:hypothetical protein SUGI_1086900 [Cryptomeria japonica]